jgi:hypothetical protein
LPARHSLSLSLSLSPSTCDGCICSLTSPLNFLCLFRLFTCRPMLLKADDVLDIYVEPFIHSGFRPPDQPYSYYFRSLFSLHNETVSVWIHLLGAFVLVGQAYQHACHLSVSSSCPWLWIYIVYNCVGACVMLLCSAQAHLLHSRTLADHLRCFYFDYFGINFYGFTSGVVLRKFSHRQATSTVNKRDKIDSYRETRVLSQRSRENDARLVASSSD